MCNHPMFERKENGNPKRFFAVYPEIPMPTTKLGFLREKVIKFVRHPIEYLGKTRRWGPDGKEL